MNTEIVSEWLRLADMDLAVAEHSQNMHPQPLEIICFHCQQAAEKYLKAYLTAGGIDEPPHTHDLELLMEMCMEFNDTFSEVEQACAKLTIYAVKLRYPKNEIEITKTDVQRALVFARQVRDCPPIAALRVL